MNELINFLNLQNNLKVIYFQQYVRKIKKLS